MMRRNALIVLILLFVAVVGVGWLTKRYHVWRALDFRGRSGVFHVYGGGGLDSKSMGRSLRRLV